MQVNLTLPTTWNELSDYQLKNIVHQLEIYQKLIKEQPYKIDEHSIKLHLQLSKELLIGNKFRHIRIALNEIQPKEFITWTQFLYKINRTKFIKFVKIRGQKYFAPDIRFRNVTIAEFSYVDAAYYNWRQSQKETWLNVLCAAIYRERKKISKNESLSEIIDIRIQFIKTNIDLRADKFKKLNLKTKLAIAYTYEGCRNHIAKTFPNVFPAPIKVKEKLEKPVENQKYHPFGEIIIDKIKGDPSKLETTNKILLYDFLSILEKDIKEFKTSTKT